MARGGVILLSIICMELLTEGLGSLMIQERGSNEPAFATSGKLFKVVTADTVVLPCEIINLGNYVLAWKRGIAVLSAGSTKVSPDDRYKLVDGYNLEIRDVTPQDAGEYVCQIGTLQPKEVKHTLQILVPPVIRKVSGDGSVIVKKGISTELYCEAEGNPVPNITWTRKNDVFSSGKTKEGSSIVLEQVSRHTAGVYQCSASNGVGRSVTREITVHVQFPPEIQVEKGWIHSGEGNEANLVCIVHAVPHAEVVWYRDTLRLDTTERRSTEVRGSRHTLIIRKVQASDFGNYSCLADNGIGKTRQYLELSGKPQQAQFRSHPQGRSRDSYNITWAVQSYTPIEEYRLYYRRVPAPTQIPNYQHARRPQRREENEVTGNGYVVSNYHKEGWQEIILPAIPSEQYSQTMSYIIKGLDASTQYEAKVHAKNRFGWNLPSDKFHFTTRSTGYDSSSQTAVLSEPEMRDMGVKAFGGSCCNRINILLISSFLLVLRWT